MAQITIFLTSGSTWTVPADCVLIDRVDCIGAGGPAAGGFTNGGGGGAWSRSVNIPVTPNSSINIGVGTSPTGSNGGDTWFNATSLANAATLGATVACAAQGGFRATSTAIVNGGQASAGTGTSKFSGGRAVGSSGGGGGGGAAGPNGNGNDSAAAAGGAGGSGDAGFGGAGGTSNGGAGGNGTEYDATHGSGGGSGGGFSVGGVAGLYGGGRGAVGSGAASAGAPGLIVIVYTQSVSSANLFNSPMLGM